ncbi:hypothetical protein Hanom_Chr10g00931921 [Helianthus anomalus]
MAKYSKCKLEFSKCQRKVTLNNKVKRTNWSKFIHLTSKDIRYVWQKYLVAKEEFSDEEVNCESSSEQAVNFLFWFRSIHFR